MAIEMVSEWFGIEQADGRFLVRDLMGVHASFPTRDAAIAWINEEMARIDALRADGPSASIEEYLDEAERGES